MTIIVHGVGPSPFVRKVRVALTEKGVSYELKPLMPMGVSEEYKKISPLGKIPCYEEDGFTLPDSSCILAYLEHAHPTPSLYPSDAKEFGRALWYEEYADTKLRDTVVPIFWERAVKPNVLKQECDEERVQRVLREEVPPVFDYLEREIGGREVLMGVHFSIADIAVASFFVNLRHGREKVDARRWPKLAAYVERIHARPSFKALIEEERRAFAPR